VTAITLAAVGGLLERRDELASIAGALDSAAGGRGGVLVLEGAAGIGKTRLLGEAVAHGRELGCRVLTARGGEFEHAFPFGVVRQLFEAALAALPEDERSQSLAGAAARAGRLLGQPGDSDGTAPGDEQFAIQHGLYWLVANLAARQPLVLAVDDAHWCDTPSLRWLAYLSRRVAELPVLVAVAARPAEPGADQALAAIVAEPHAIVVRPGTLGEGAVGELIEQELGRAPDAEFRAACHTATGGNPFLLGELARELVASGVEPTAGSAFRVLDLGPQAVSRAVLLRLGRLPAPALEVARAVAVLGERAELRQVAALEGLDERAAGAAADALADANILARGRPLDFVHPIVRTAIHAELPPSARAEGHARAARLLHADAARVEAVASHLLETEPDGDPWVLERLLEAARRSIAEGATDGAGPYLRRALKQDMSRGDRARLLLELGVVEARLSSPSVVDLLREALELADDAHTRGLAAFELGRGLALTLRLADGAEALEQGIEATRDAEPELARKLRAELIGVARLDDSLRPVVHRHLPAMRAELEDSGQVRSLVLANLAWEGVIDNAPAGPLAEMAAEALEDGTLLASEGSDSPNFMLALAVLLYADRYDLYDRHVEAAIESSRERGSALGFAFASCLRAYVNVRRGQLSDASDDATRALEAMTDVGWKVVLLLAAYYLADAKLEMGDVDGAEAALSDRGFSQGIPAYTPFNVLWQMRGRIRAAQGDLRAGLEDLLECGRRQEAAGVRAPAIIPWRSDAAMVHAQLGALDDARRLAAEEVELARAFGAPRTLSIALRTAGAVAPAREGIPLLRESLEALGDVGAELDRAKAEFELGAALRRAGQRSEPVELLRAALERASRCGADPLERRVRDELRAAGVRPRRTALTGVDSLTPSERRVAELVAQGLGNAEIAQALFVTRRTVEYHLTHAFRKLGVSSREELAEAVSSELTAR
jgi:DNA-binding CsgD family transcriptional regulator